MCDREIFSNTKQMCVHVCERDVPCGNTSKCGSEISLASMQGSSPACSMLVRLQPVPRSRSRKHPPSSEEFTTAFCGKILFTLSCTLVRLWGKAFLLLQLFLAPNAHWRGAFAARRRLAPPPRYGPDRGPYRTSQKVALGYPSHVLNGAIGRAFARTRDERLLRARLCSQRWEANL